MEIVFLNEFCVFEYIGKLFVFNKKQNNGSIKMCGYSKWVVERFLSEDIIIQEITTTLQCVVKVVTSIPFFFQIQN